MWKKTKQILKMEIGTPTHIKIWNNPSVKIQGTELRWKTWMNGGIEALSDIISSNNISSFDTLKDKFKLKDSDIFKYMQLKNWVKENCDIVNDVPEKIKTLLEQSKGKKKCISVMYDYLNNVVINCNLLTKIYESWDRDIKDFNAKTKWKECLNLTYKATKS